ncbi:MAG: hypothetical protein U9Q07_07165 [Planctomycetota bacterium]|nr:hypothetical protein [Planctomycetota bacterium]
MACERDQKPALQAELTVNGQEIERNNFVQDLGLAVTDMVKSLKGVADVQTVTLSISKSTE